MLVVFRVLMVDLYEFLAPVASNGFFLYSSCVVLSNTAINFKKPIKKRANLLLNIPAYHVISG